MEISISTSIFPSYSGDSKKLSKALEMISLAGFKKIEFSREHFNLSKYEKILEELGLKVWAVHGLVAYEAVSLDEQVRTVAIEKDLARMEDSACFAPCPDVVHYVDRSNVPQVRSAFRKSIDELLIKAKELDFSLAIETVPYKPLIDERYADSKEISDFVRARDSKYLSVCLDLNHSNLKEDLVAVADNCKGLISNIHVSNNHGKTEDHCFPDDGVIDLQVAVNAIVKTGYKGPLNLECHTEKKVTTEMLKGLYEWAQETISVYDL